MIRPEVEDSELPRLELFPWREDFNTGIELIDQQHRELVRLLNQLAEKFVGGSHSIELEYVLEQLGDYADYHFSTEEAIWHSHLGCEEEYRQHCDSHRHFFDHITRLRSTVDSPEFCIRSLLDYLTRWLAFHILYNDRQMALQIRAIQDGSNTAEARLQAEQQLSGTQSRILLLILDMYGEVSRRTLELMRERRARQQAEHQRDTLELALNEERQQLGEALFHEVFEELPHAILLCRTRDGQILRANPAAGTLCGHLPTSLLGMNAENLLGPLPGIVQHPPAHEQKSHIQHKDGHYLRIGIQASQVTLKTLGECTLLLMHDRSEQDTEQRELERIAFTDSLTGLPNRIAITRAITLAMSQRGDTQQLAVIYIDLDKFKMVNDTHGEMAGNRLLCSVAKRWQALLGTQRPLARLGGDEFLVLIPDTRSAEHFSRLLTRLFHALNTPFVLNGQAFQITASAGISLFPQTGQADADTLIRQADQAMYQAKLGGNGYRYFDEAQERNLRNQQQTLVRLRQALERRELILHYQPKINLNSGAIIGVEALLRWQHPQDGLIPPAAFLPLVEDDPLSIDIGDWVMEQALRQLEGWHAEGLDLPISINVAALQLQDTRFVEKLASLLSQHSRIHPSLLELEVLESSAIVDMQQALDTLRTCRALGVSVALDDFGTGYSSLSYLKQLPVQTLKIDRSFVRDMLSDDDDLNILQGIISLAKAFGLEVIAEGVENIEQGRRLIELGCHYAQGYVIACPMPAGALIEWMQSWQPFPQWQSGARTSPV